MSAEGIHVKTVVNGIFHENCYLVWEPDGRCVIIDPGDDAKTISSVIGELELVPVLVAATHAHIDCIGAVADIREQYRIPFLLHEMEADNIDMLEEESRLFGLPGIRQPEVDRWIGGGEQISFGAGTLTVVHTPGHTAGSVCFLGPQMIFSGDTLFAGGYGRSDLPGGDEETLRRSVSGKLFALDDNTIIYSGHGPSTTVLAERQSNWIVRRPTR